MRTCSKCKETKPPDGFYRSKSAKDGLQTYCIECKKAYSRALPPGRNRQYWLKHKYRVSVADMEALLEQQGWKCACCGTSSPAGKRDTFVVDHCHDTGAVRGLLCNNCNVGIGRLGDTLAGVMNAVRYLSK
jgi:hypothetical protein